MTVYHKEYAAGKWFNFTLMEQLGNVGSDVERAIQWKNKGNQEYSTNALYRALELIDLTVSDPKNKGRLKEILCARELLVDYFMYDNEHQSTDKQWQDYFYQFAYAAAIARGR